MKKRMIITISENGIVTVPNETKMSITEIADLFGIYYQTTKRHIRAIEKSKILSVDYSMNGSIESTNFYPDYYELEMVIALAFRVYSLKANIFRKWIGSRLTASYPDIQSLPFEEWASISLN